MNKKRLFGLLGKFKYNNGFLLMMLVITFLTIDLVSKLVVSNLMIVHDSIMVIKDFFYISYFRNTGGAWSIFSNQTWLLVFASLIIICFLVFYIYKNKPKNKLEIFGYSLILGGAFGNFLDRIIYGYVIDFLDFNIFGYNFPIFNLADTFIVLGVVLLIVYNWRCSVDV